MNTQPVDAGHVHAGMSEAVRLKRLINGFKTYKTFDLTQRVNNIIGLRHCRRSASLCPSDLLKCQKLVGSLFSSAQPATGHSLYIF